MRLVSLPGWIRENALACLVLAGVLVRCVISILFGDNHSLYFEHMLIARNILAGHGYSWDEWGRAALQTTSLVPPLYVYWCVFFQWLSSDSFLPMYLAQALIAATGCIPAFRIGKRVLNERVGILFAALYAFWPEIAFLHSRAVAESIYLVLVLWMIERYLYMKQGDLEVSSMRGSAFLTGLLAGVAMLVKEGAVIVAFAMIAGWAADRSPRRKVYKPLLLPFVIGIVLALSPWIIRNALEQGRFIPLRTAYGINLWIANQPVSAGNDRTMDGGYVFEQIPDSYKTHMAEVLPFDEQDRDCVYASEVVRFIREHPGQYLQFCAKRLFYYVWFVPVHPLAHNLIYRICWITLLLMSIPGLVVTVSKRQMDAVFPLIIVGFLLLYIPVSVLPRYRTITVAILLLFAAVMLDSVYVWWQERRHL